MMAETSSKWMNSTLENPLKRRAGVVCTNCSTKKVKCDLEKQRPCTNCERGRLQHQCEERKPKRVRQSAPEPVPAPRSPQQISPGALAGQPHESRSHRTPKDVAESHEGDVDTGFLRIYRRETHSDAYEQALNEDARRASDSTKYRTTIAPGLLHTFVDTYFENCYTWCPVLDRSSILSELTQSPLLTDAVALAASHIRPPILPHDGPVVYYDRARRAFYDDQEPDALANLKAVLLFYWWAPQSTSLVHRHSSWWWTSVVIRQAQVMNMHREPTSSMEHCKASMRRRIWWTAFARERLTALCQSKPVLINPEDVNLSEPSLLDFPPPEHRKAEIFIQWVKLCAIIGRIAQHLARSATEVSPFPRAYADELVAWVRSLPQHLALQIGTVHTTAFNKDVHQLYLPYLTAISILHLEHSSSTGTLPKALPPAIMAASCVARIMKDILARGTTRFLMPITSWYCGVAFMTLASAARDRTLSDTAKADMEIVRLMCDQLQRMWGSAKVVYNCFDRLKAAAESINHEHIRPECLAAYGDFNSMDYFPFASNETSPIAALLLASKQDNNVVAWSDFLPDSVPLDLLDWLELSNGDFSFEIDTG